MQYINGDAVELGDIVDVGFGHGPQMRVVVLIASNEAVEGFDASEWEYLRVGAMLQDQTLFGLLHIEEFDHEEVLVRRA